MIDEVEEGRLSPLEVVEDDHERPLAGQPLEDPASLQGDLVAVCLEVELVRQRLDLGERPVRDALAVRQAPA